MGYLIDTNIWSELQKDEKTDPGVQGWFQGVASVSMGLPNRGWLGAIGGGLLSASAPPVGQGANQGQRKRACIDASPCCSWYRRPESNRHGIATVRF